MRVRLRQEVKDSCWYVFRDKVRMSACLLDSRPYPKAVTVDIKLHPKGKYTYHCTAGYTSSIRIAKEKAEYYATLPLLNNTSFDIKIIEIEEYTDEG